MDSPLFASLPAVPAGDDAGEVGRLVARSASRLAVLDDDPTGTQTVHGVDVLADWSIPSLAAALRDPRPCFYVLANTRSLPADEAVARTRSIVGNLSRACAETGVGFAIASRSDSTLRGHFGPELAAVEEALGRPADATIVVPAFFEGGRYTVGCIHYAAEGGRLVPVSQTEFARDPVFGYRHSDLRDWIEEKTAGRVRASEVASIDIQTLRSPDGAGRVLARLLGLPGGAFVVVDAAAYPDLEVFAHGLLRAEAAGRRFLLRTAASFVRVRAAIGARPPLAPGEIRGPEAAGGLVVVGSYTRRSSDQLASLLELPGAAPIELRVGALADAASASREEARVAEAAGVAIRSGGHAVVHTSRGLESAIGRAGELAAGRAVSAALVRAVRSIGVRPRFLLAKGGITASDLATEALGMRRARVLGQAVPGVPVWRMGPETRFPGLAYVLWPGNVGGPRDLRDLVVSLS